MQSHTNLLLTRAEATFSSAVWASHKVQTGTLPVESSMAISDKETSTKGRCTVFGCCLPASWMQRHPLHLAAFARYKRHPEIHISSMCYCNVSTKHARLSEHQPRTAHGLAIERTAAASESQSDEQETQKNDCYAAMPVCGCELATECAMMQSLRESRRPKSGLRASGEASDTTSH